MSSSPLPHPPTLPSPHPVMGHWAQVRDNPLTLFIHAVQTHGDMVRFRVGPRWIVVARDPAAVKQVLQDEQRHFSKRTRSYAVLRRLLGNGLVTSEGEFWL